jgi:hypothetical protein
VDKLLCFLLATLTLLGLVAPACSAHGPVTGGTPRQQGGQARWGGLAGAAQ